VLTGVRRCRYRSLPPAVVMAWGVAAGRLSLPPHVGPELMARPPPAPRRANFDDKPRASRLTINKARPGQTTSPGRDACDAASAVRGLVDTLARDLPAAGFGAYSGSEWLLSPGYHAARGKWPSGLRQIVPASVVTRAPARAVSICQAGRSSADLAALLRAGDAGSAPVSFSYGANDILDAAPYGIDKGTGLVRGLDLIGLDPAHAKRRWTMASPAPSRDRAYIKRS
jgi:hypothetical protein